MNDFLSTLASLIEHSLWLAPLIALFAGVLTSLMPCCLSTLPLVIAYVGGTSQNDTKKAFKLSLTYVAGSALTFTLLGVIASFFGGLIGKGSTWWYIVLGILMVLMALQTFGIFNLIPSTYLVSKSKKTGYIGAFIAGVLGGVFSTPCSTPVLIALLAIVAGKGSVLWGVMLLLIYAVGNGALAVFFGTSVGMVKKLSQSEKFGRVSKVLNIILGVVILLLGFYFFYIGF